jgi:8-oxo-dGTP pyrophosphatase MutT (NUDIX family)
MSSKKPRKARKPRKRAPARGEGAAAPAAKTSPTRRARRAQAREFSAGGVVVRDGQVVVIVPTRRAADGSRVLALPKGHVDPGERPLQTAAREVREETGILVGEPICELGESRYWYRRDGRTIGKSVAFFLFEHAGGDTADHDDEVEEVRWIALEEALTALSHQAEREMIELALAHLRKDR